MMRQEAEEKHSQPKSKLENQRDQQNQIPARENNFSGWDVCTFVTSTLGGISLGASANFYGSHEFVFQLLAVTGLALLAVGLYAFVKNRSMERKQRQDSQRQARCLLFREKFTDAVRIYKSHSQTEKSQIIRLAFQEAYSLAPVEDGDELKEAMLGVSPTLGIDFEGAHFQGLLNIYHTAQLHWLDLSKHSGSG